MNNVREDLDEILKRAAQMSRDELHTRSMAIIEGKMNVPNDDIYHQFLMHYFDDKEEVNG